MEANPTIELKLPRDFVGQILDGLETMIDEWENTAEFLEHGVTRDDMFIRECSDEREAQKIAKYYKRIRDAIEGQMELNG